MKIILEVTPGNKKYIIYYGPIVEEQFRLKTTGRSVKVPSFQSTIVVDTKCCFWGSGIKFFPSRSNLPVYYVKLEKNKGTTASLPNTMCINGPSIHCFMKVS